MPRLLMVTTVPATIEAFLLPFARHFVGQGWHVDALSAGDPTAWGAWSGVFADCYGVQWSRDPYKLHQLIAPPRRIREIVAAERYDIVHVHTPVGAFVTRFALRDFRRVGRPAVIYTAHGFHFYDGGQPLRNAMFRNAEVTAGKWLDYLVVINREDEAAAHRYGITAPERIRYMPGIGVDLSYYGPDSVPATTVAALRAELGLPSDARVLLMVGEFIPRKRQSDLLHALARLGRPQTHVLFAGNGPTFAEMQQLAASLGIAAQTHFLGRRSDIPALMRLAEFTVLPSAQEGLPRCVLESLSMATMVIGSDIRGTRDLLREVGGMLYPMGDIDQLASMLAWTLDNPDDAARLGQRGREVMAHYDVQSVIAWHEALYGEALALVQSRTQLPVS